MYSIWYSKDIALKNQGLVIFPEIDCKYTPISGAKMHFSQAIRKGWSFGQMRLQATWSHLQNWLTENSGGKQPSNWLTEFYNQIKCEFMGD